MNLVVMICLVLWPFTAVAIRKYHQEVHGTSTTNVKSTRGKSRKRDQTPVIFTEDSSEKFHGIQADSLGLNNQATLSPKLEKEAVVKELEDGGGPVFEHDAQQQNTIKEPRVGTESNDMSRYDDEDINLVTGQPSFNRQETPKSVRLPSLTHEGKVDTVITTNPKSEDKILPSNMFNSNRNNNLTAKKTSPNSNETDGYYKSINAASMLHDDAEKSVSNSNNLANSKGTESSLDEKDTESTSKTTKDMANDRADMKSTAKIARSKSQKAENHSSVKIVDLPESKISEDDAVLPKSSNQLLGESDDSSMGKLRKEGERMTMFYDHDINAVKKVERPSKTAQNRDIADQELKNTAVNVKGGQIGGGQITGGNILGGQIEGGFIGGGTIKGGDIRGGRMIGGLIDGGVLMDGTVEGGFVHNGTIKGGDVKGGNITGGVITGGVIVGGHVSSGLVSGGVLKKGGVEGGALRGGTIDGGILKGGVMESGRLIGGTVWNGRVTGGTILGGQVLGGEVGEGVVIRGGRINGTVTVGRKKSQASLTSQIMQQSTVPAGSYIGQTKPVSGAIGGLIPKKKLPLQIISSRNSNGVSTGSSGTEAVVLTSKTQNAVVLSNITKPEEEIKRTYEPSNRQATPSLPVSRSLLQNYVQQSNSQQDYARKNYLQQSYAQQNYAGARSRLSGVDYARISHSAVSPTANEFLGYAVSRTFQQPLAVPLPRDRPVGININQFVKQVSNIAQRSSTENIGLKPDYHWILNQIKDGEVTGIPGKKLVANGGIRLNRASIGFDGVVTYMDGGDYAGSCVSDPNLCSRGLSIEMTFKVDPEATMYRDPRYILDTGASSFNSRGVALYTIDNKLRADVAVWNKAYCLVTPLTINKWQDVFITYNKNGAVNMYLNCKLLGTTESDEHCISCHTPGCHTTDKNTKLILGRANNEPKSGFAKFKAGDLSIYERYLTPQDIDKICGFSKSSLKPSAPSRTFMPTQLHWRSPVVNSFPRTQPGFLKSDISNPTKHVRISKNVPYFSAWSSWSTCSTTCGDGTKVRQRSCIYSHAQSGWQTCHGVTFQAKKCSLKCSGKQAKSVAKMATQRDDRLGVLVNLKKKQTTNTGSFVNSTTSLSRSADPKRKEYITDKQDIASNDNKHRLKPSRRNRISRILSKLGTLLGKL